MKCPIPLRDPEVLKFVEEQHQHFSTRRQPGSFTLEFHYDRDGQLQTVNRALHRLPAGPAPKGAETFE
jgi:hypothetical protein